MQTISIDLIVLSMPEAASPMVVRVGDVFARQIARRCPARIVASGPAPLIVALAVEPGIGAEGFRIEDRSGGGVKIVGNDTRGLLYGVGKFLRASRYERDGFVPGSWRGSSVPWKPVRGIYFATHFHNFYHEAPVEEIEDYVEDLALWGFNELLVWYDLHHFNGPDDPEAVAFRERLRAVMATARRIGMDVSLGVIGNEGYADSPEALRATPGAGRGGYYPCGVCPSRPEGMAYLLETMGITFDWVADLSPRSIWVWPYDQGSCGCEACRPWGSQGFMTCVERIGGLARAKLPGAKLAVSTWFMDPQEIAAVMERLSRQPGLADRLIVEGPVPAAVAALGLPVVGFPEIGMHETFPWGGFGATPLPARAQLQWDRVKSQVAGGFPYSEGIYEDITKAVYSQFYWSDRPVGGDGRRHIPRSLHAEHDQGVPLVPRTCAMGLRQQADDPRGRRREVVHRRRRKHGHFLHRPLLQCRSPAGHRGRLHGRLRAPRRTASLRDAPAARHGGGGTVRPLHLVPYTYSLHLVPYA
ncbi:MAG: hypothetical protein GX615_08365 [Lentisphaerae bacterium]|nr:hypothetical protein [Lentisphaerota bacterium]